MCGIVAMVSPHSIVNRVVEGLERLKYRGYDSAGVVVMNPQGVFSRRRAAGKLEKLREVLQQQPIEGTVGIGHTRWATHGAPSEHNAHPHVSYDEVALVHNGIIENYVSLRAELESQGFVFESQTDTEVIAHLFCRVMRETRSIEQSARVLLQQLEGQFSLAILHRDHPEVIVGVRKGAPLVLGVGEHESFLASDPLALLPWTQQIIYLEDLTYCLVSREQQSVYDLQGRALSTTPVEVAIPKDSADKGHYAHFMLKEIEEQPQALAALLEGRLDHQRCDVEAFGANAAQRLSAVKRIHWVACGTSYLAASVGAYLMESFLGIPSHVEIASEYRYRQKVVEPDTLLVLISQSGETADTLAALREVKSRMHTTLAICNVPESSLVRECDLSFLLRIGPEIGVASTKAFTAQLTAIVLLMMSIGQLRQQTSFSIPALIAEVCSLPRYVEHMLGMAPQLEQLAAGLVGRQHALFLGRGPLFPIAQEGALKLKELSYIHAEAFAAGELKHGPLALVDHHMPVIALAPTSLLFDKMVSNISEVRARGGRLLVFSDHAEGFLNGDEFVQQIHMPRVPELIIPMVYAVPLQLLAYYAAVHSGADVDQPRNLAKSVTVE